MKVPLCPTCGCSVPPGSQFILHDAAATTSLNPASLQLRTSTQDSGSQESFIGLSNMTLNSDGEENELQDLQSPTDVYEHQYSDDLVSDRVPTGQVALEFVGGDPNFQRKLLNLSSSHPFIRRVRGDGNCGWRALAYGYFEMLLLIGDKDFVHNEEARVSTLQQLLIDMNSGFDQDMLKMLCDPIFDLFREMRTWIQAVDKFAKFHAYMNNPDHDNYVIYYFRLIASSYIRYRDTNFEDFLDGISLEQYCHEITQPGSEIEEAGIQAIFNTMYNPTGLGLIVLDLNRDDSEQVHSYQRHPQNVIATSSFAPYITLFYRPGHYDLIYPLEIQAVVRAFRVSLAARTVSGSDDTAGGMGLQSTSGELSTVGYTCDGIPPPISSNPGAVIFAGETNPSTMFQFGALYHPGFGQDLQKPLFSHVDPAIIYNAPGFHWPGTALSIAPESTLGQSAASSNADPTSPTQLSNSRTSPNWSNWHNPNGRISKKSARTGYRQGSKTVREGGDTNSKLQFHNIFVPEAQVNWTVSTTTHRVRRDKWLLKQGDKDAK